MSFKQLLDRWSSQPQIETTDTEYAVRLPIDSAARLLALADLYSSVSTEEIITDLLSVALDEIEEAMPYIAGEKVIREDEFGDPVFEDAGPTPKFEQLRRAHLNRLGGRS